MTPQTVIVEVRIAGMKMEEDLEIPLDITVNDFLIALKKLYNLEFDLDNMTSCCLKTENPIALLKGSRPLKEFGIRSGTIFNITK